MRIDWSKAPRDDQNANRPCRIIDLETGKEIECTWADDETGERQQLIDGGLVRKTGPIRFQFLD